MVALLRLQCLDLGLALRYGDTVGLGTLVVRVGVVLSYTAKGGRYLEVAFRFVRSPACRLMSRS